MTMVRTSPTSTLVPMPCDVSFQYSSGAQVAIQGGPFDARQWLTKPRADDLESWSGFRLKLKVLDIMDQHPEYCDAIHVFAEGKAMGVGNVFSRGAAAKKKAMESPTWNITYCFFEKLPHYWRAEFLVAELESKGLTEERVLAIEQRNSKNIDYLFDFFLAVHGRTSMPREMLNKEVCTIVCRRRMEQVGRATAGWLEAYIDNEGDIDWVRGGCYSFVRREVKNEEGNSKEVYIVHRGTGDSVEYPRGNALLTKGNSKPPDLVANYHDFSSKLEVDGDDVRMCTKFKTGMGPNKHIFLNASGRHIQALASFGKSQLETEKAVKSSSTVVASIPLVEKLEDSDRKRKREAAAQMVQRRLTRKVHVGQAAVVMDE